MKDVLKELRLFKLEYQNKTGFRETRMVPKVQCCPNGGFGNEMAGRCVWAREGRPANVASGGTPLLENVKGACEEFLIAEVMACGRAFLEFSREVVVEWGEGGTCACSVYSLCSRSCDLEDSFHLFLNPEGLIHHLD